MGFKLGLKVGDTSQILMIQNQHLREISILRMFTPVLTHLH